MKTMGFYNLVSEYPEIASEFHPRNNCEAATLSPSSNKRVWWVCSHGHEWMATVNSRTNSKSGCPYCSGRVACSDNNLSVTHPEIASQWDHSQNKIGPEKVVAGSHHKVWWDCGNGHGWQAKVYSRTKLGSGCPICTTRRQVSKLEMRVYAELKSLFPDCVHSQKVNGVEVDVLIPSIGVAIEVDGSHWHGKATIRDLRKNKVLSLAGLNVIRLRESPLVPIGRNDVVFDGEASVETINLLLSSVRSVSGVSVPLLGCFNNDALYLELMSNLYVKPGNTLSEKFPNVAKQWHPTKNGKLSPWNVSYGSKERVWWVCERGHEWKVGINSRTSLGCGCKKCHLERIKA